MLVCVFLCACLHTRPRVQRAPGLPCALCFLGRNEFAKLGRMLSRDRGSISIRRPGLRAGTHTARTRVFGRVADASYYNCRKGLWVPAQGRDDDENGAAGVMTNSATKHII